MRSRKYINLLIFICVLLLFCFALYAGSKTLTLTSSNPYNAKLRYCSASKGQLPTATSKNKKSGKGSKGPESITKPTQEAIVGLGSGRYSLHRIKNNDIDIEQPIQWLNYDIVVHLRKGRRATPYCNYEKQKAGGRIQGSRKHNKTDLRSNNRTWKRTISRANPGVAS